MHVPKNIPILDEEYMKRKEKERRDKIELEYWKRANRPYYYSEFALDRGKIVTTEEQDKELFVQEKITEEELIKRTERRVEQEKLNMNMQLASGKVITKNSTVITKIDPYRKQSMKRVRNGLFVLALNAWILAILGGNLVTALVGYPLGVLCFLVATRITLNLRR